MLQPETGRRSEGLILTRPTELPGDDVVSFELRDARRAGRDNQVKLASTRRGIERARPGVLATLLALKAHLASIQPIASEGATAAQKSTT